jgi:hypothetical protein
MCVGGWVKINEREMEEVEAIGPERDFPKFEWIWLPAKRLFCFIDHDKNFFLSQKILKYIFLDINIPIQAQDMNTQTFFSNLLQK